MTMASFSEMTRKRARKAFAICWGLSCFCLLIHTLYFRHSSSQAWWNVEETEFFLMGALSGPTSLIPIWLYGRISSGFHWWPYAENDARTILAIWFYFFFVGCVQWFVIVPWLIHKVFDAYDRVVLLLHRKR